MVRPVKLSRKRNAKGVDPRYYVIAIPREIGDQFPDNTWFFPKMRGNTIILEQAREEGTND